MTEQFFKHDSEFGEIVDFEAIRPIIKETTDKLLPDFDMIGALEVGSEYFDDNGSLMIAAGASMLAWMMLLAAEEYEIAEELKGKIFTLGWTEEHTGSDLLSLSVQATPMSDDPDEKQYHIKGEKWLINNSYHADYHSVLAKIDPTQDGPRSMSLFLVPHSSTKNWKRLETHVLRDMVLTKYEIDGPGTLMGKKGHGLSIVQRMAMPSKYQVAYQGTRSVLHSVGATIDHLSRKEIFKDNPINFSNVYRQMYRVVMKGAFLDFVFQRAALFSDSSFLAFHGTMLKSWVLLRVNEVLSQNWLIAGSKGFLKESIIGRDAIDSFVYPVFDGHYTINTLITAKQMDDYINADRDEDVDTRIHNMRQNLYISSSGNQINRKPREIRRPQFYDNVAYWKQLDVPVDIDVDAMFGSVRSLVAELDETNAATDLEYKYKTGTLVHWVESVMAAGEFWKVMDNDDYLNVIIMAYNDFVTNFNMIVAEGGFSTSFLQPLHLNPIPETDNNEAKLRELLDIKTQLERFRQPVAGD